MGKKSKNSRKSTLSKEEKRQNRECAAVDSWLDRNLTRRAPPTQCRHVTVDSNGQAAIEKQRKAIKQTIVRQLMEGKNPKALVPLMSYWALEEEYNGISKALLAAAADHLLEYGVNDPISTCILQRYILCYNGLRAIDNSDIWDRPGSVEQCAVESFDIIDHGCE